MQLALKACGLEPGTRVLAALSGGADSTAMTVLLSDALHQGQIGGLCAAHFHHGLRGAEADRDAAFSEGLCRSLSIPFYGERADVAAAARERGESVETAARALRYGFLFRTADACGADVIAVAHNLDDQAETVLMHLIRGSGTDGLAGMRPRSGRIVRPLLHVPHQDLVDLLTERGIAWCEDSTNALEDATRNRVRHTLMPVLTTFNPRIREGLARTAALAASDADALGRLADDLLARSMRDGGHDTAMLRTAPEAVRRRAVRQLLLAEALPEGLTGQDILRVEDLLEKTSGTRMELRGGRVAMLDGQVLRIGAPREGKEFCVTLSVPGTTVFPGGSIITRAAAFRLPADGSEAYVSLDAMPGDAVIRTRRPGDRFHPLGGPGTRLLSDVMTDRHVPPSKRDIPLICSGNEVLWMPGYTVSERLRVSARTERVLYMKIMENGEALSL